MAERVVQTVDPAETESLGAELAGLLGDGDVVLVRGELGSGKTTFVRGAARALGVEDPITSPTFTIGHRYRGANVTVSHLDLYRLAGLDGEDPALLADHLGPGTIAFIEWPEAAEAEAEISARAFEVTLSHAGGDRRLIEVQKTSGRCEQRSPGAETPQLPKEAPLSPEEAPLSPEEAPLSPEEAPPSPEEAPPSPEEAPPSPEEAPPSPEAPPR